MRLDSWFFPGTPFDLVHILSAITVITSATILILRHRRRPASELTQTPAGVESEDADTAQNEGATVGGNGKHGNDGDANTRNEIKVEFPEPRSLGSPKREAPCSRNPLASSASPP